VITRGLVRALALSIAAGVAVVVLGLNWVYGAWECGKENNGCARGGPPRLWQGRVFTESARPAERATVRFYFASVNRFGDRRQRLVTVTTDQQGRYCLRWPVESQQTYVSAVDLHSGAPPDPALVSLAEEAKGPLVVSPDASGDLNGGYLIGQARPTRGAVTSQGWDAADATSACVAASPPWYRIDSDTGNWRYRLLVWLPLATLVAVVLASWRSVRKHSRARRMTAIAMGGAATCWVLYVLVWSTHTL
jgi:hypothetical protein